MTLAELYQRLQAQDFGPDDSMIASAIMNPRMAADRFKRGVRTASGLPDEYDNPTPYYGATPRQQAEAGLGLAGMVQTGAMPMAPVGRGGTLGTMLKSLNPTGTLHVEYNPLDRATLPLDRNMGTLSETMGVHPDEMVTIYRGVPHNVSSINPGDFVTTNKQLAKDYAGTGKILTQKVRAADILDDINEPLGEEYIYRPTLKRK